MAIRSLASFVARASFRRASLFVLAAMLLAVGTVDQASAQHAVRMSGPASELQASFPADRSMVEVPFRFDANKIVVPIGVNGSEPLDFVFDTGASSAVMLDFEAASEIEFDVFGQAHLSGAGEGGSVPAADVAGDVAFEIGGMTLSGATMAVLRGETSLGQHSWAGIVGRQILDAAVVEIDWARQLLRLHDPARYRAPEDARILPLERRHGHAFVRGEVELTDGSARPVELVIDSGAFHALALDARKFETIPEPRVEGAKLGRGLNGVIRGDVGRIAALRLGGFALEDVVTRFPEPDVADMITSRSDGNLGAEVLRRFVVAFDYSRRQMVLQPTEAVAEPFRFSTAGFAVHPDWTNDGSALVDDLYPGSPAQRAGLAEGDEILSFDGRRPTELGRDRILDLLEQDPGTVLTLVVRRDGEPEVVELTLERIL